MTTVSARAGTPRVTFEDRSLPHQVVILALDGGRQLAVSCTCLHPRGSRGGMVIESRTGAFPAGEALAAWRSWHEKEGIPL